MASIRNTLFSRLLDQRDAKAQQQAQLQAAGMGQIGKLADTATDLDVQEQDTRGQLAQGLGQAAGISGEAPPELADARMQQYADVGYAPAKEERAKVQTTQAAEFMKLRQEYEKMKQTGDKNAADKLMDEQKLKLDQDKYGLDQGRLAQTTANDAEARKIGWYDAKTRRMDQQSDAAKAAAGAGKPSKASAAITNDMLQGTDVMSALAGLDKFSDNQVGSMLTNWSDLKRGSAKFGTRMSLPDSAVGVLMDPKERAMKDEFTTTMTAVGSIAASLQFGKNRVGQELREGAAIFLNPNMDASQYVAAKKRMKESAARYVQIRRLALGGEDIATISPDELDRRMDAYDGQMKALAKRSDTSPGGVPRAPAPTPDASDEADIQELVAAGLTLEEARQRLGL